MKLSALAIVSLLVSGCTPPGPKGTGDATTAPSLAISKGGGLYASAPLATERTARALAPVPHRDVALEQVNADLYGLALTVDRTHPITWNGHVDYTLGFRGLPKGTRLSVIVAHDVPRHGPEFAGRSEALYGGTPSATSADLHQRADFKSKTCFEIDLGVQCTMAPGRYRLEAVFVNPPSEGIIGAPGYKEGKIIGRVWPLLSGDATASSSKAFLRRRVVS